MSDFYVNPGDTVTFAKTVGETDIYLFAGITGDFSVNHVNEQYMARSKYGRRIAHGALMVGYMSACSTMISPRHCYTCPATASTCRSFSATIAGSPTWTASGSGSSVPSTRE